MDFQAGPLSGWSSNVLPKSVWVFSGHSGFLPHPKDVYVRGTGVSNSPNLNECGAVGVRAPCVVRVSCSGWLSTLHPEL